MTSAASPTISPAAEAVRVPALSAQPGVRHAFFTRRGGVSTGLYESLNGALGSADEPDAVRENRARMARALGVAPERFVSVWQTHSPDVVVVTGPWPGERPKVDAMVTDRPGLALAVASADCGPVLFADASAGVIGAAHAGWRGALGGVLEATLEAMERLGARRERIVAALGPMIGPSAYEVGPEFVVRFCDANPGNDVWFTPSERPGHAFFDLPGYSAARLSRAGAQAAPSGLCTFSDEARFFSYRRATHRGEPDYGRLLSAIALQG